MVFSSRPITYTAAEYYNTTPWWMGNFVAALGGGFYIPCMFISTWFTNTYGLRRTLQLGGFLLGGIPITSLSAISHTNSHVSCLTVPPPCSTAGASLRICGTFWSVMVGQSLNAMLGPIVMASPPRLSVEYFTVSERNTATAISYSAQSLGVCLAFLWSPNAVHTKSDIPQFIMLQGGMMGTTPTPTPCQPQP